VTFVACGAVLTLLWRIVVEPLDHGYIRYAGVALEMVRSGDWVVPRLRGEVYLHKPPLYPWIVALPMSLAGGCAGWVQHAPNLLALGLLLGFTYRLGRRIFGARGPALAAAALVATSYLLFTLVRGKRVDPLFAAWLTGAFYFAYSAWVAPPTASGRTIRVLAAFAALGAAVLTKGPLALLFFAGVLLTFGAWTRRLCRPGASLYAGMVLCLAIMAAWPALLVARVGLDTTLEVLARTPLTTRFGSPLHYIVHLPLQLAPWSLFLPALVVWLVRERPDRSTEPLRFLLCWVGVVLLLLLPSAARHSRYLAPAYPALCLLMVALWVEPGSGRWRAPGDAARRLRDGAVALLLAVYTLAGMALPVAAFASPELGPLARVLAMPAGGIFGLASVLALRRAIRETGAMGSLRDVVLLSLAAYALFDVARALDFQRQDKTSLARAGLAPLAGERPARSYRLDERPDTAVFLITDRLLSPEREAGALAAWVHEQPPTGAWVLTDADGAEEVRATSAIQVLDARAVTLPSLDPLLLLHVHAPVDRDRI
jgi:4-amino-4-deoxy-L-arabinose transferase-like glycosyltransferase